MTLPRFHAVLCTVAVLATIGCPTPSGTIDANLPDAPGADVGACSTAAECDDGLACNGVETCADGRCAIGTPMRCDDGIACTTDFCSEELRRCVQRPVDADGDGIAASTCVDARGMALGNDCNDADPLVYPDALEVCDPSGRDEDCNTTTHGALDGDRDGFEDARCCNGTACGMDCNDAVRAANPDATEVCNAIDDDCDGRIDEGVQITVYRDADGDGRGVLTMSMSACASTPGYATFSDDCDDGNRLRSPALPEVCDGIDNDCDGTPDPTDLTTSALWYRDSDSDGFGDASSFVLSCTPPTGTFSLLSTDCNDSAPAIHPGQGEVCNGIDDDCNGAADFSLGAGDFEDDDHDGIADSRCTPTPTPSDCDDRDPLSAPGVSETCDGRDNDCDSRTDEAVASTVFFRDADGDGFGSITLGSVVGCTPVAGYVARGGDCDETSAFRFPGAVESCNGSDDDCDRGIDEAPAQSSCEEPGSTAGVCIAGSCRGLTCDALFADCNMTLGLGGDGCETNLTNDPNNCGQCGGGCSVGANQIGVCAAQECSIPVCAPGFFDCDLDNNAGEFGNGCESTTRCPVDWGTSWGGMASDQPAVHGDVVAKADGTVFVATSYYGALSAYGTSYTTNGTQIGSLILAFDSTGAPLWRANFATTDGRNVIINRLAADPMTGDIIAAGTGVGPGTLQINGAAQGALSSFGAGFVVRLNATTGNVVWIQNLGVGTSDFQGLTVSPTGEVVIAGSFTTSITLGGTTLTSRGFEDSFVARLNAAGAFTSAFRFGGPLADETTLAVGELMGGDVIVAGRFNRGNADIGIPLTTAGFVDGFYARFTRAGTFVMGGRVGGLGRDDIAEVRAGTGERWYIAGFGGGNVTYGPTAATFPAAGSGASGMFPFVAAIDGTSSSHVTWFIGQSNNDGTTGGSSINGIRRLRIDSAGNIRTVFSTQARFGLTTFGGAPIGTMFTSPIVASITPAGVASVRGLGGSDNVEVTALDIAPGGALVVSGAFHSYSVGGRFRMLNHEFTTLGDWDQFLMRLVL